MKKALLAAILFFSAGNLEAQDFEIVYERTIDGDTFVGTIMNVPDVFGRSIPIRLAGLNTAEIRYETCLKEADMGNRARDELRRMLEEAEQIVLTNVSRGKFFRVVAEVYADDVNVGDVLLISGLALPWNGRGEKPNWCR